MIEFSINKASGEDLNIHFSNCTQAFVSGIERRMILNDYVAKIRTNATTFELWEQGCLVGLIAVYINRGVEYPAYITNVSVITGYQHRGLSKKLMDELLHYLKNKKFTAVRLEVEKKNVIARSLYDKYGFELTGETAGLAEFRMKRLE